MLEFPSRGSRQELGIVFGIGVKGSMRVPYSVHLMLEDKTITLEEFFIWFINAVDPIGVFELKGETVISVAFFDMEGI